MLHASDGRTKPDTDDLTEFAVSTSQSFVAGQQYVAFPTVLEVTRAGRRQQWFPCATAFGQQRAGGRRFRLCRYQPVQSAARPGLAFRRRCRHVFRASFDNGNGTPVPQPVSLAVLGAGLLALGLARRRRSR